MEIIFTSLFAFASTNLDDIFILALFFGSRQFSDKAIVLGQFVGIGAKYVTLHPLVKKAIDRFGHIITPVVLILLGLYIFCESGTIHLLGF